MRDGVQEEGHRISLGFEPWFTESDRPGGVLRPRIDCRWIGDRVVLERFAAREGRRERTEDLNAAYDALPSRLDYVSH